MWPHEPITAPRYAVQQKSAILKGYFVNYFAWRSPLSSNAASFVGDIPSHYDTGLGPNIFVDYADLIVQQCQAQSPQSVVELAAGTGIVSKRLRDALPQETRLVVTDLNGPMLDIAKTKFADTDNVF